MVSKCSDQTDIHRNGFRHLCAHFVPEFVDRRHYGSRQRPSRRTNFEDKSALPDEVSRTNVVEIELGSISMITFVLKNCNSVHHPYMDDDLDAFLFA